jgi:C-terminal binding-module, SLH-like, of glucodextranase
MKKTRLCPQSLNLFLLGTLIVFMAGPSLVLADPFHTPTIDGSITGDGLDWSAGDFVVDDRHDVNSGRLNLRELWCTWDATNLYVGAIYQDFSDTAAFVVYFDLDKGLGPDDASQLDAFAGQYLMPGNHRFELVIGRQITDGFGSAVLPVPVLVTSEDGAITDLSGVVTASQGYDPGSSFPDKALWANWNKAEFAIPWSSLYPELAAGTVPPYAEINAVAVITRGLQDRNGLDSAPDNDGLDFGESPVTFHNMHSSIIDADGDGVPDPCNASISGTVDLPDNDGERIIKVSARLNNFPGGNPIAALSTFTGAEGVTTYTLPRLPAGDYTLTISSVGYLTTTTTATVTEGQQLTGEDLTLVKSASISGTISFVHVDGQPVDGMPGTITLSSADGTPIDSIDFPNSGGQFTFFLEEGGEFILTTEAEHFLDSQQNVTLQTGQDLTGVDVALIRKTMISGTIGYLSGPGTDGTVLFLAADGDTLDSAGFSGFSLNFSFFTDEEGQFTLSAKSPTYARTDSTLTVVTGTDITGIDLIMPRSALISATFGFEGPETEGQIQVTNTANGQVIDTQTFDSEGSAYSAYLDPGQYLFALTAPGYVPQENVVDIDLNDQDLGYFQLIAVRATKVVILNDDGEEIPEVRATFYDPDEDPWTASQVQLAAWDDDDRLDLYDLENQFSGFRLSALKMDDISPATGNFRFYASNSEADTSSVVDFQEGRAQFWMSDTAVEVLRVYLAQPDKAPVKGRIVVAFEDPRPTYVVLTAERDTLVADNEDQLRINAQLYDSALKESLTADVPVTFSVANSSSGVGGFQVATTLTNANGFTSADLTATGAGTLNITCSVVIGNRVLIVRGGSLNSEVEIQPVTSIAGPTAGWEISLLSNLGDLENPLAVTAQLIDQYGNSTRDSGLDMSFSAFPSELGSFSPATASTDTNGRAVSDFIPSGLAGMVTISGSGAGFVGNEVNLSLHDLLVIPDPVWYNEPRTRQTFEPTDLTALVVDNDSEALFLEIPFSSSFAGMQLHVLFETNFDAAGASTDPFLMPVDYAHENKPDFVLTTKYSADDYGDFRRPVSGANPWEKWKIALDVSGNPTDDGEFVSGDDGQSVQGIWTTKTPTGMSIRIPWAPFGGSAPDSLKLECYLTQEDGVKRSAFDSAPLDSTLNLTFDWENPEEGDWDIAETRVSLQHYGDTYVVKTDFPTPPNIIAVTPQPAELNAGEIFVLLAEVSDALDGIGDVLADVHALGGSSLARMYDDGDENHGDTTAGDGIYSLRFVVPWGNPGGEKTVTVQAFDASNATRSTETATVTVEANIEPILIVEDALGDDHGPNQEGSANKYYTYPTNLAFVPGSFDLTRLTVYETTVDVGGEDVEMIAFQIGLVDFPDPADPGTANWSPLYGELNIEKFDIMIDSGPGGATSTLPMRQAAFQRWDAWDYAIVMDGWYKAVIPSLGQNTLDSWRANALRTDRDIIILGDPDQDVVTAFVSKTSLGNPTPEEILGWDMVVVVAGHDFGGEEVLGGCRWVNESRSEWQFGGGKNEDKDSNLMDILLVPGSGHTAGLPQEEILDYESPAALERLAAGDTPVAIEMSQFEDTGPPVIDTGGEGSIVTQIFPIEDAPIAMTVGISDDYRVDAATFRYRSTGFIGEGWDREVPMGYLGRDRWVVDILPSWLDSNLVYSPIDSTRYLEFEVYAVDPLGKSSTSPVTTLQIWPNRLCRPEDSTLENEDTALLQVDGSALLIPDNTRRRLIERHLAEAWTGEEVSPDTMGSFVELQWDICEIPESIKSAQAVPPGTPLNVFRNFFLATADTNGGYVDYPEVLPGQVQLSLHYPQDWVAKGTDENMIALYQYNMASNRWVLVGGNVTPTGNNVTATVTRTGTYGLFRTEGLAYDPNEVISGIAISPNPFSPNGDGLYDETTISFFLSREATVTVEIYNIQGIRKRMLTENFPFSGTDLDDPTPRRVPGLVWDGRESNGDLVPYGIYVLRIIATYNQAGGTRSIRSNHSLAVIR